MTLAIPTASSIKMLFSEFIDVSDPVVEFAIEQARVEFGDGSNWSSDSSATLALIFLSAHYVAEAVTASASGGTAGEIASESIGRLSITYTQTQKAATATGVTPDDVSTTSYGRRYLQLIGANFSGPRII